MEKLVPGLGFGKSASESGASVEQSQRDVGYNGAEVTQQQLQQRCRSACLKHGWLRPGTGGGAGTGKKLVKLAEAFTVKFPLFKVAAQKIRAGGGQERTHLILSAFAELLSMSQIGAHAI